MTEEEILGMSPFQLQVTIKKILEADKRETRIYTRRATPEASCKNQTSPTLLELRRQGLLKRQDSMSTMQRNRI